MLIAGLDIETTGLSQVDGHLIIEVAVKVYELESCAVKGQYTMRINPQRGIDAKAQEVHGISYDMLVGKPLWEDVAPKLSKLLSHCQYVVAHNGEGFDLPFIWGEFLRVGVSPPEVRVLDTMLNARWATPDGSVPRLSALCFACGVPYDEARAHGAAYDVDVMMACVFSQIDRGFFQLPKELYRYSLPKRKG